MDGGYRLEKSTAETLVKVYAVLAWVGAVVMGLFALFFFGMGPALPGMPMMLYGGWMQAIAVVMLAIAVLDAIVGWGLWTKQPWARIAAIVVSVLQVFSFPIGTLVGGFGIYLFGFEPNVQKMFK